MTTWKEELQKVEQCPQRQDSLTDQMIDLYSIVNKFGFYDAADFIKGNFMDKSKELLIKQWNDLNKQAHRLLAKHKSFREYNAIRLKMDKIEDNLHKSFGIDVYELEN